MVTLNRIYTRTGDAGATRLAAGQQVSKSDPRVEAYGAVDETNACIGLARIHSGADPDFDAILARIQNELFDLGADLATPPKADEAPGSALRIVDSQVARLEAEIDRLNAGLPELKSFILPAGAPAAAALHLARTVCRRAERAVVTLMRAEPVNPQVLVYLNRLSDFLFVLGRVANDGGKADVLWVPGQNR